MSDSTRVDPDALLAFGHQLTAVLQGLGPGPEGMRQVEGYTSRTSQARLPIGGVSLGISGMREAAYAGSSYAAAADAATQFLADTCDGLLAFTYVAGRVAETYRAGDAEQADQMTTVGAALAPPPGQPSIASVRADALALEREAARFANRVDGTRPVDPEVTRFLNQVAAAEGHTVPRATGGSTVDNGRWDTQEPLNTSPGRYAGQVRSHDQVMTGGGSGGSAEDDYDPQGEYQEAVERAARRSEVDRIPYVVVVDDHGNSEIVQQFPGDVPYRPPADYVDTGTTTVPTVDPAVLNYTD